MLDEKLNDIIRDIVTTEQDPNFVVTKEGNLDYLPDNFKKQGVNNHDE